ncbi:MAG: hypothetical protein KME64_18115 [Scytonematopsis contorta HA4267-MV1]|jgi:hypothetical protein|nr:hypothetical protein [Scytonematopsis contorta HA4267-MV1]
MVLYSSVKLEKQMLDDPEQPREIWTDYVWADNEAEALQKCQLKAERATGQLPTLTLRV